MDSFVNGINAAYKKGIENPVFKKAIDEIAKGPVTETEKVAVVNKKQVLASEVEKTIEENENSKGEEMEL